jgi:beta-lactamase regulating signal transducer with metallopeptidase domain
MALAIQALLPIITAWMLYRPAELPASSATASPAPLDWALPVWIAGVAVFSLRPIGSWLRVYTLRRGGTQPETWIAELGSNMAKRMGMTRAFGILSSAMADTPAVAGWLRPVILLPAATVAGLTVEQLETILAHEIAHIRRHDYLVNLLQVLIETLLFYHPAVWWVSARIRLERELCCDDEVIRLTSDRLCYARALTQLEKLRGASPALAVRSAGGQLSWRIRRLFGDTPPPREHWPAVLALALALTCAVACVRSTHSQPASDDVTVEVTRDAQGVVTGARVVSGPSYLSALALQAALQMPQSEFLRPTLPETLTPPQLRQEPKRVQTFMFPAAFENRRSPKKLLQYFFNDRVTQAENAVNAITGQSPEDRKRRAMALTILAAEQHRRFLTEEMERPEKSWRVQVLRQHLYEFREQYKGKLSPNNNPALESQYAQMQKASADAERDLESIGVH